jgi:hypothetical protein
MHHDSNAMLQILSSVVQRMEQHLPRGCVLTQHPEDYMDRIQRATEQVARQFGGESFYQLDPRALP